VANPGRGRRRPYTKLSLFQGLLAVILLAAGIRAVRPAIPDSLGPDRLRWPGLFPLIGALIFMVPLWLITWVQNGALIATAVVVYCLVVFAFLELVVETPRSEVTPEGRSNMLVLLVMLSMASVRGGRAFAGPPVAWRSTSS